MMKLSDDMISFILEHQNADVHTLALQSNKHKDIDINIALNQISARQIAKLKIPSWYQNPNIVYPKSLSLEQASSEDTARYKAKLFQGNTLIDLTGGLGVDFYFISQSFQNAVYVEKQRELVNVAKHNFDELKLGNYKLINSSAEEYLNSIDNVDCIYIDPARRDTKGRKTVLLEDCVPNILSIQNQLEEKADTVVIKLSPLFDISSALTQLRNISDIYIVGVKNEVKELLLVKKEGASGTQIHCVNLENDEECVYSFKLEEERSLNIIHATSLSRYLYEPNASIMKAGAYKSIAQDYGIEKLALSSHLYTSDKLYTDFPGRVFIINSCCGFSKKEITREISQIEKANLTIRNFPSSVDKLRKRLKLKDGGDAYIFATTLVDTKKVLIICEKI